MKYQYQLHSKYGIVMLIRLTSRITEEARMLWEGWRGMEEYAREVFPLEEQANGMRWML
jgi:hypothetical protein